ncbi:MAG: DUF4956 domain-containing protein [Bacteroidota bacterium]|nr:MAG: DUF4956 domain-containing protein [Bacteroidota bacterium]
MVNFIAEASSIFDTQLFGIKLIEKVEFTELVVRFLFNLLIVTIAVRFLYYPSTKRKDYLFTYILISTVIFLLCILLDNVKLQIGFALGLFAIFGIIRYRTNPIPIKEMTYLFLVIGISVINALANKKVSYAELLFTNFSVLIIALILEKVNLVKHESSKIVEYEKIELIKKDRREELIADLEERTGIKINRIEIGRINFLRDTVRIRIHYYEENNASVFNVDDYGQGDLAD